MSKFKIELITKTEDDLKKDLNDIKYISSVLTDYESGRESNSLSLKSEAKNFSFTFDEDLSIHKNAQKELKFSMYQKIFIGTERIENPFVFSLHVGSQLLLTDEFNVCHLFTVKDIAFTIQELNIVYKYTCQDTFNYQLIRQRDGYEIINDPKQIDFLGAKSVDFWADKIATECYITSEYVNSNEILYIKKDGIIEKTSQIPSDCQYMIKNKDNQKNMVTPISFSCSGANAASALIKLGEEIGYQVQTFVWKKNLNNNGSSFSLRYYFWLEPDKKNNFSGLEYSPDNDLKSLSLDFTGNTLSSIMNIESTKIGDRIINLLPPVPLFFKNLFASDDWENENFHIGYYNDKLDGDKKEFIESIAEDKIQNNIHYRIVMLPRDKSKIPLYYDRVKINYEGLYSFIGEISSTDKPFLIFIKLETDTNFTIYNSDDKIDSKFINNDQIQLGIGYILQDNASVSTSSINVNSTIYLQFYYQYNQEDKTFADMADACPYLENKIIDFSYFRKKGLISQTDYERINERINNDLRRKNGLIIEASQTYYNALNEEIKEIALVDERLDKIGAEAQSSLIGPYQELGEVGNTKEFLNSLNFLSQQDKTNKKPLINYNRLVSDTLNEAFDAEQRFFKNMKNFRDYFDAPNSFGNKKVYNYKMTAEPYRIPSIKTENETKYEKYILNFEDNNTFETVMNGTTVIPDLYDVITKKNIKDFYHYESGSYQKVKVPNKDNFKEFYISEIPTDALLDLDCKQISTYNSGTDFYLKDNDYERFFSKIPQDRIEQFAEEGTTNNYIKLLRSELTHIILKTKMEQGSSDKYYVRLTNFYVPFDWIRHKNNNYDFLENINLNTFLGPVGQSLDIITEDQDGYEFKDNIESRKFCWKNYKNNIPLEEIYYYGEVAKVIKTDTFFQIDRTNELDFQPIPFITGVPSGVTSFENFDLDAYIEATTAQKESFNYFAITRKAHKVSWRREYDRSDLDIVDRYTLPGSWRKKYSPVAYFTPNNDKENGYHHEHITEDDLFSSDDEIRGRAIFAKDAESAMNCYLYTLADYNEWPDSTKFESLFDGDNGDLSYKKYFNYYGLIAATYSLDIHDPLILPSDHNFFNDNLKPVHEDTLWVKNNSYYRILTTDSKVNLKDTYKIIYLGNKDKTKWPLFTKGKLPKFNYNTDTNSLIENIALTEENLRFSKIRFGFLTYKTISDIKAEKVQNLINSSTNTINSFIFYTEKEGYYIVLHEENYERAVLTADTTSYQAPGHLQLKYTDSRVNLDNIYEYNSDSPADFLNNENDFKLLENQGIKVKVNVPQKFIPVALNDTFDSQKRYYEKVEENEYVWRPTIDQITASTGYYYIPTSSYNFYSLHSLNQDFTYQVKYSITKIVSDSSVQKFIVTNYPSKKLLTIENKNGNLIKIIINNDEISNQSLEFKIRIKNINELSINNLTNGEFWLTYHDKTESGLSVLRDHSLSIEAQLNEYWMQAYDASTFCDYFIPETWTPRFKGQTNKFYDQIIQTQWKISGTNSEIKELERINLNIDFVPKIKIVTDEEGKTLLTNYYFKVNKSINNPQTFETTNIAIQKFKAHLMDEDNIWNYTSLIPDGYRTYYEHQSGGITWSEIIRLISDNKLNCNFSGWKVMKFKYLVTQCDLSSSGTKENYERLIEEKSDIWKEIYRNYPALILETKFHSDTATNEQELLDSARMAFKDLQEPEKAYNLTIIDLYSLQGYKGQQLQIGDAIRVNALDFDISNIDILDALRNFLFVTDLSYKLRNSSDVKITVNSLKYQDKLLQQLVSLIR